MEGNICDSVPLDVRQAKACTGCSNIKVGGNSTFIFSASSSSATHYHRVQHFLVRVIMVGLWMLSVMVLLAVQTVRVQAGES